MAENQTGDDEIVLSLISHTNVGKTALARTLLRRDVGEVADRAHVTVVSEAYTLIEREGKRALLWDTPGFGSNLAKLANRLRSSGNPVGWILHQAWDRWNDRSLWCSQEAIRNIQADADVVLYLVDATQSPATAGYIDLELEILEWIGKPVLVYLNQVGQPDPRQIERFEREWKDWLAGKLVVRRVSTLDAFTRCWVQEHLLLERASEFVSDAKAKSARFLSETWKKENLRIFEESVSEITQLAVFALTDTEPLPDKTMMDRFRQLVSARVRNRELDRIQSAMYERLAERTAEVVNRLISLHGIDGKTAKELARDSREAFSVKRDVEESIVATVGGAVSGLVGGLSADLISGGMTFGGGAIVGMLLGGATTFALAWGYNLARTGSNLVRWTEAHFLSEIKAIAMLYLATAHFGRGRGVWQDPENNPAQWEIDLDEDLEKHKSDWESLWKKGGENADEAKLRKKLRRELEELLKAQLIRLYPEAKTLFA